jgi:glycosyltransferase involved in cell wall biosynthesis
VSAATTALSRERTDGARHASRTRVAICAAGEIWGGVEQCVLTLARELPRTGFSPLVVLFYDGLLAARLRSAGVDVEVLPGGRYDPRAVARLRDVLRRERIRLLHVHGYKAAVTAALAGAGLDVTIVKTEHGLLEPREALADSWRHARLALNHLLDRLATHAVDTRVFVSRALESSASRRRPSDCVIHNGVEPHPRDESTTLSREHFHVAIVGRVSRVKGHRHLIGAISRLTGRQGVRVHVFGVGPLEGECRRLAEQRALGPVIVFHGFVSDLRARLAAMDLLVMPSLQEGLPYVLLEAMAAGVPVVASSVGGLPEALQRDRCGLLVPPGDEAALAAAIETVRRNGPASARMAARARTAVRMRFSAAVMADRYAALYARVLREGRPA